MGVAITQRWTSFSKEGRNTQKERAEYIEYGIGLHGERGIVRTELQPVNQLVDKLYHKFMDEAELEKGDEICVLINGLGSISLMELAVVSQRLCMLLKRDGFCLYDADVNNYCASYESNGFSITLFKMEEELKKYYDAPCYTPYYHHRVEKNTGNSCRRPIRKKVVSETLQPRTVHPYVPAERNFQRVRVLDVLHLRDMMIHVADCLIQSEDYLSELDSLIGDGDHGICIANGMRKARQRLIEITEENTPFEVCQIVGKTMFLQAGGASGAFFGSMYMAAAESVKEKKNLTVEDFYEMWREALMAIEKRGGARRGEKTLVDALAPAVDGLREQRGADFLPALKAAEEAAQRGMLDTKNMTAKFGRGRFLADRTLGCQDAGATTIWLTFKSMYEYVNTPNESLAAVRP